MEERNQKEEFRYGAQEIQVLEGLEAVRKRPGMYIGSTSVKGLHHLVHEIVDNAVDEALAGFCSRIIVEILPGNVVRVRDNGRGIPVGVHPKMGVPAVTVVFTVLHAGGKFGGQGYKVAGGLHGVGSSVVNALSEWLEVEVFDGSFSYKQRFERGNPVSDLIKTQSSEHRGTLVEFKADSEIFKETTDYDSCILASRLREQAFLNAGLEICFKDLRDGCSSETFKYDGGISSFVEFIHKKRALDVIHEDVIHFSAESEDGSASVEIAMQYNVSYNELLISFANNIHTNDGGTHEEGFKVSLTKVMNSYARSFGFLKESDKNFLGEDVREGLCAIISVKLVSAQFEGQTKARLGNSEIKVLVERTVSEKLKDYLEENPASARSIVEKASASAKAREAAKKARDLVRRKTVMESASLPGALSDCQSKDPRETEIYVVEGESAGGSARGGRDRYFQAILPLRGKMLNVEKARLDKVYGNEKLMPVVTALGCGIGSDLDISKLRYNKIIIMADADVDGSHIRTLLLTFFFRFFRKVIEDGHIFIAKPPLYRITKFKKHRYAFTDEERDAILSEVGGQAEIQRYKGLGEMDPIQLWETTMNPETRVMLKVSLEDATLADEVFTILMGEKVEPRRDFIEQNARYVVNLDI
ncbi:MAG: DNA topoisomerase (ATP-hydrolyzing) subunit B [Oscillospiraceae bacterium]|nr:DNA topoisomerase (ATP-hydrolyzing) subunit B [Oscillospiraceae bacterium]